jgi:Ca2+-transporting ATPase
MIMLAGFILTFVGAGIFTIANGTPLLPLQILWINFAVDIPLAFGLGFDAESPGLMQRKPRPSDQKVIERPLGVRLGFAGLLIAIGTLIVVAYGEDRYGLAAATTMGFITISLLHVVATLEWRDPAHTAFRRSTIANGRFNRLMLLSLALAFLATTIPALNRMLDTVLLTGPQWRVCGIAVVAYVALAELGKVLIRRIRPGDVV